MQISSRWKMINNNEVETSIRLQMFFKIGVAKNFAIFTGKQLRWSLFLIELPAALLKKTLAQVFFCEFCGIFKSTFFTEHLQATVSVEMLRITIDRKFQQHINNFRPKTKCIIGNFFISWRQKKKFFYNTIIKSQFNYCPLVWVFCSRKPKN